MTRQSIIHFIKLICLLTLERHLRKDKSMSDDLKNLLNKPEKRHYQRLDITLDVSIEFDGQKIAVNTGNISCGGMFLPEVDLNLKMESNVMAFINLPDHTESIRLPATVRRVETYTESKKIGIALEFNRLYDDNRLQIDRFVKWKLLN